MRWLLLIVTDRMILPYVPMVLCILRYALKKKNDIIWEFFPNVGPPHS